MASVEANANTPALAAATPLSPLPRSRMDQLYRKHRSVMARLDDLESRLASRVAAHRRRAMNLIEETPTSRRTHMRIFVSHRVEGGDDVDEEDKKREEKRVEAATPASPSAAGRPSGGKDFSALLHSSAHQNQQNQNAEAAEGGKRTPPSRNPQPRKGVRRWTLVVEGGLLVPQSDHASAKLPILGCGGGEDDGASDGGASAVPLRDQWRGGTSERENEREVEPLLFTHLFDRLEVELKAYKKNEGGEPQETAAVTRSGIGAVPGTPPPDPPSRVENFAWERARSDAPDSHAFFVAHDEESEFKPVGGKVFKSEFKVERVVARIKLYRRKGDEDSFVPSAQMCDVFFPTFIGKKAAGELKIKDKSSKSKKRKRSGGGGSSDPITRSTSSSSNPDLNDASNSSAGFAPPGKEAAASAGGPPPSGGDVAPSLEEKDVHVPNLVTMDEALHAVFFYIRSRNLQDATDRSVVNNDARLSGLFGCDRMPFSSVRGLLLEKRLLARVDPGTQPIVFNYDMTLDGAEPLTKKRRLRAIHQSGGDGETVTRSRSGDLQPELEPPEDIPLQTMLSCDVDVDVPNLFHVRTRDILRRTKHREFEYTSGRIKAVRSLMAARVGEETAKQVMVDLVMGRGYAPHHRQAWTALARGSHDGGEARGAVIIDLRTATLTERLEGQCAAARGWWDVADACRGLCDGEI